MQEARRSPSSLLGLLTDASDAEEDADICATLVFVVYASESLLTKARSQALRSLPGNTMDPIADMLSQIKNAGTAGRQNVVVGYSRLKHDIAEVLKTEGYIKSVEKKTKGIKSSLSIGLFVENRFPKVKGVKRISKPSKRIYKKVSEIRPVKQGYGIMVISTPEGVMAGYKAKKAGLGGEAMFSIW